MINSILFFIKYLTKLFCFFFYIKFIKTKFLSKQKSKSKKSLIFSIVIENNSKTQIHPSSAKNSELTHSTNADLSLNDWVRRGAPIARHKNHFRVWKSFVQKSRMRHDKGIFVAIGFCWFTMFDDYLENEVADCRWLYCFT